MHLIRNLFLGLDSFGYGLVFLTQNSKFKIYRFSVYITIAYMYLIRNLFLGLDSFGYGLVFLTQNSKFKIYRFSVYITIVIYAFD